MAFAIMRCKKLKTFGGVAASLQHNYRERETPNADPTLTHLNQHMYSTSTVEAMNKLRDRLPEKRRKDATLAVEYLFTASPEWWGKADAKQQAEFFQRSHQWLADKYGEHNIIAATIQRDETSPHLSAFVVPITADGRLTAKAFIGSRKLLSTDQTTFAAKVQSLGLERGIEGSKAKHTTIREYYARVAAEPPRTPAIDLPAPGVRGALNPGEYGRQVADAVLQQVWPMVQTLDAQAKEGRAAKERLDGVEKAAIRTGQQLQETKAQQAKDREAAKHLLTQAVKGGPEWERIRASIIEAEVRQREKATEKGKGLER